MFNKKHITAFAALTLSAMLLAGCQENAEPINIVSPAAAGEPTSTSETAPAAADETVKTATSTVIANKTAEPTATVNLKCTLPDSAPSQMALYKTKPFWFEDGLPEKLLLEEGNYRWYETRQNEYFPEISVPIYDHVEDDILLLGYNCNGGGDLYYSPHDNHMYETFRYHYEVYDPEGVRVDSIDGMTPEEAVAKAKDILGQLGITNLAAPDVWAVTAKTANEFFSKRTFEDKQGNIQEVAKWTPDDEVYYLRFPIDVNGTPIAVSGSCSGGCTKYGWGEELATEGTYIDVTIRKDGTIFYINTMDVPSADVENIGTADINITAQQAFEIFENGHHAEDYSVPINVIDCSLVYVMTDRDLVNCEHVLKPMWKFEATYEASWTNDGEIRMTEFVDASTGVGIFER
ncbi:MAG: hypothetical protein HDR72_06740 [Ruminococcaceae bacterium]|nr:hypothetical protein [Oscillospiraceae bacterium]